MILPQIILYESFGIKKQLLMN